MGACVNCGGHTQVDAQVCEICQQIRVDAAKEGEDRTVLSTEIKWTAKQAKDFIDGMAERDDTGNVDHLDKVDQFCMNMVRTLKRLMGMP